MIKLFGKATKPKEIDLTHLARIAEGDREDLPVLRENARNPQRDHNGQSTSIMRGALRNLAQAAYWLNHDVEGFRRELRESAEITLQLFRRAQQGEPIDYSFISVLNYSSLYDLLAAADFAKAKELARYLGWQPELDRQTQIPFSIAFGYAIKHLVLEDENACRIRLSDLAEQCREREFAGLVGYQEAMTAILEKNGSRYESSLSRILTDHRRLIAKNGFLYCTEQTFMCVWGLGLTNLARSRGLAFSIPKDEFLPQDLVID
jgi:hypothetical protein